MSFHTGKAIRIAVAAASIAGMAWVSPASAAPTKPPATYDLAGGKGRVEYHVYGKANKINNPDVLYDYVVYLPAKWKRSERLPLYVLVHGCGTTAKQMMGSTLLNPIADRERFIIVYPDNQGTCWRAVSDDAYLTAAIPDNNRDIQRGGGGDADIVAGITKRVSTAYNVNRDRVYMMGMSSGAFQTSATASAYPELYAAAGVNAGGGPGMAVTCLGYPEQVIPAYSRYGVDAMGSRAHVMPFFAIGGDGDPLGEAPNVGGCSRLAYKEWLYINNTLKPAAGALVPGLGALTETGGDTFQDDPSSARSGQVRNGHAWTKSIARGPDRCQIAERWVVKGMGHYWSGGSTNPVYTSPQPTPTGGEAPGFNDPKGPSASQLSWNFFKQFSLKRGNSSCAKR